ncbi:MAG: thioesterase family protein [Acidimicrobiales bacterium]
MTLPDGLALRGSQVSMMAETLRVALLQASSDAGPSSVSTALARAAQECLQSAAPAPPPHPAMPAVGDAVRQVFTVREEDTAAAMGHPDVAVSVLGSPKIALWFEVVPTALLSLPAGATHVGVGILVHHLDRADVGEEVAVDTTVASTSGRRVVFTCAASVGSRVVALGVHQRVVILGT